jgi:hypothetical protein
VTPLRTVPRSGAAVALIAFAAGGTALVASLRVGPVGLLAPLLAVGALAVLTRPAGALALVVSVVVLCEGDGSGPAPGVAVIYDPLAAGLAPVDGLLALAVAAVAVDVGSRREPIRLPGPLALPLAILALAAVAGAVTGLARGASLSDVVFEGRSLAYLVLLPIVAVNALRTHAQLVAGLVLLAALAVVKAALGLFGFAAGQGRIVDGSAITYYEPLANLLMLMAIIAVPAALVLGLGDRLPAWLVLAWPVMIVCFVLSFRRSFWIGLALAALLLLAFTMSPSGRRMLVPLAALLAAGVWALGSVGLETQGPIVERVDTLRPSRIAANAEDRYRIDERVNVLAELRSHPIAGLGLAIEWSSAERPLPVEHINGRRYVHMVSLWHWLKLGVLGLIAYAAVLAVALVMAWRIWRRHPDPLLRVVGLTMVCGLAALAAVETTASYTGVESRVSILLGLAFGALAVAYREAARSPAPSSRSTRSAIA